MARTAINSSRPQNIESPNAVSVTKKVIHCHRRRKAKFRALETSGHVHIMYYILSKRESGHLLQLGRSN
jgi:hypothetical protein